MTTVIDYKNAMAEQSAVTMRSENEALRAEIQSDIEAFLARKGKISVVPFGVSAEDNTRRLSEKENRERMKKHVVPTDSIGRKKSG